jgi:16S rRNA U516 pseudouridylate synthase RsuA-like enzyme
MKAIILRLIYKIFKINNKMTKQEFKDLITNNFVFVNGDNITDKEKNAALDQLVINCAPKTVNPNPQRPIIRK